MKTHIFQHRGRSHQLYARRDDRNATWYFRIRRGGKAEARALRTHVVEAAITAAKAMIDAADSEHFQDFLGRTNQRPKPAHVELAEIYRLYALAPIKASPDTRKGNVNALKNILTQLDDSALRTPHSALTTEILPDLAKHWHHHQAARITALEASGDATQETGNRIKRTANSTLNNAKSLFVPRALAWYADSGISPGAITAMRAFYDAYKIQTFERVPVKYYNPPSDQIIEATLKAWELLPRDQFLAVGLALAFGLRKSEIAQARWDWLVTRNGRPALDTTASAPTDVKSGTGLIQVQALDPWWTTLNTRAKREGWLPITHHPSPISSPLIIPGSPTYRRETLFNNISQWLREQGWNTTKTIHALRDYSGSQIVMKYGVSDASRWLRHSSVKVTERHYTQFVSAFRMADKEAIPARWAEAVQTFIPTIVAASGL